MAASPSPGPPASSARPSSPRCASAATRSVPAGPPGRRGHRTRCSGTRRAAPSTRTSSTGSTGSSTWPAPASETERWITGTQAGDPRLPRRRDVTPWPTAVAAADHPVRLVSGSAVGLLRRPWGRGAHRGQPAGRRVPHRRRARLGGRSRAPAVDAGASVAFRSHRHRAEPGRRGDGAAAAARPARARRAAWLGAAVLAVDHAARRGRCAPAPARPPGDHRAGQPRPPEPGAAARHRAAAGVGAAPAGSSFRRPTFALRVVLGEFAGEILGSQRIVGDVAAGQRVPVRPPRPRLGRPLARRLIRRPSRTCALTARPARR